MHFQSSLLTLTLALASTTLALPAIPTPSATPATPAATPTPRPADDTRDWPKFISNPSAGQGSDRGNTRKPGETAEDRCSSLCSLVAEACVVAVPNDEAFW